MASAIEVQWLEHIPRDEGDSDSLTMQLAEFAEITRGSIASVVRGSADAPVREQEVVLKGHGEWTKELAWLSGVHITVPPKKNSPT